MSIFRMSRDERDQSEGIPFSGRKYMGPGLGCQGCGPRRQRRGNACLNRERECGRKGLERLRRCDIVMWITCLLPGFTKVIKRNRDNRVFIPVRFSLSIRLHQLCHPCHEGQRQRGSTFEIQWKRRGNQCLQASGAVLGGCRASPRLRSRSAPFFSGASVDGNNLNTLGWAVSSSGQPVSLLSPV